MPKMISAKDIKGCNFDKSKYHFAENFNKNHCITPNTRLVVVGTITPPAGNGYFYTSPANKIYGYLDETLNQKTLKALKMELIDRKNEKNPIILQIKENLIKNRIGFLDIMKYAIRKNDSPYDNDILYYSLDLEGFALVPKDAVFICNSRLAEQGYLQVCETLKIQPNYVYLSQRGTRKEKWLQTLKSILA